MEEFVVGSGRGSASGLMEVRPTKAEGLSSRTRLLDEFVGKPRSMCVV